MANSNDKRFTHVRFEKKYVGAPQKSKQKLQVDSRFKSIFGGKKFKSTCSTDSRGHPLSIKGNPYANLKEFYNLEEPDEDEDDEDEPHEDKQGEDVEEEVASVKAKTEKSNKFNDISSEDEEEEKEDDNKEEEDDDEEEEEADLARGQGNEESSSSDDSSSEDENEEEIIHAWAELDANVPETKEITRRLAVCNMNWDRMNAQDLMVVLNSFKHPEGCIQSVKIYKSQYGIERLREEELKGPKELANGDVVVVDNEDSDEETKNDSEGEEDINEKIRQYQLSRLKYFYAVVECDTPETANKIYEECDGLEYESSACKFDMRFIPDDMSFDDEEPTSVAENIVDTTTYQPKFFTTDALNLGKVSLTWDETDPEREQVFKQALESGDMEEMDLKVYLASSEEEDDAVASGEEQEDEQSQIAKYRALLQSIDEQKKDDDTGMEMTWGTDLEVKTGELVKKVMEKSLTPWEKYLEKKKGKEIEKRLKKTARDSASKEDEKQKVESDNLYSDDELPDDVNLDDPYFKLDDEGLMPEKKEKRKKKLKKRKVEETEEDKNKRAELELLLMNDEDDDKHHFNLKDILLKDNPKKKKKMMKKMKDAEKNKYEDGFAVNVDDPRFEALYSSHLYNIDPSEPNFTKTKAMQAILEEKQKRRSKSFVGKSSNIKKTAQFEEGGASSAKTNPEISMLVKSIKSKSQNFNKKK